MARGTTVRGTSFDLLLTLPCCWSRGGQASHPSTTRDRATDPATSISPIELCSLVLMTNSNKGHRFTKLVVCPREEQRIRGGCMPAFTRCKRSGALVTTIISVGPPSYAAPRKGKYRGFAVTDASESGVSAGTGTSTGETGIKQPNHWS